LLHQANDDASADEDRNARQSTLAAITPAPVRVVQQTVAPVVGFLTWSGATGDSEQSTGPLENAAATASADEAQPDVTASTAGAAFLMQSIAGLGMPQFAQPLTRQQESGPQPSGPRVSARASVAVDDASSFLSVSLGVDDSPKDGNTGILVPTTPPEGDGNASPASGPLTFVARHGADAVSAQPPSQTQPTQLQPSQLQAPPSEPQVPHAVPALGAGPMENTATAASATSLMPIQFAQSPVGQQASGRQPSAQRIANNQAGKSGGRVDLRASASAAAISLSKPANAQAGIAVDDASSSLAASPGVDGSPNGNASPTSGPLIARHDADAAGARPSTQTQPSELQTSPLQPAPWQPPPSQPEVSHSAPAFGTDPAADEAKLDATVTTAGNALLTEPILSLDIPQIAQPLAGQQISGRQPSGQRGASATVAAAGLSMPANAQASVAVDDASSSLSASLGADSSPRDGGAGTLAPTTLPEGDGMVPLSSGQLAFAARLNPDTASTQVSSQLQPPPSQLQVSHLQQAPANVQSAPAVESDAQASPAQDGERDGKSSDQMLPAPSAAAEQTAAPRTDGTPTHEQPADVRSADIDQTPEAGANAGAVRDVRLQIAGSDNQRVDVRVMDRGGELRVSVRADDPSLVRSLQDNVAELSTRLDQAHFQSEVWTPRTQAIAQTDSASTNGRTFSNGGEAFGRDSQGQQQNGRQQQQPSWVDDFEENLTRPNSGGTPQWQQ
jgi:hypothetical protein